MNWRELFASTGEHLAYWIIMPTEKHYDFNLDDFVEPGFVLAILMERLNVADEALAAIAKGDNPRIEQLMKTGPPEMMNRLQTLHYLESRFLEINRIHYLPPHHYQNPGYEERQSLERDYMRELRPMFDYVMSVGK